jgi:hypothetical protein
MPKFRSWDEVIGDSDSASNNKSWLARAGSFGQQYTDPLYWIFGEKYTNQLEEWADKSNSFLSKIAKQDPVVQADRRNNPLQDSEEGEHVGDWAENKPVDSIAAVLGAIFGGGALMGGAGAGAGGGTAGGTAGGAAGGGGLGVMGGSLPAGMEGVVVTGSSGGGGALPAAIGGGAAGASTSGNNSDWRKYTRNMSQQQNSQGSGPNAYEQFLDSQDKATRVAQALSNGDRGSPSDDYQEQVARQKQRRAIAEAMMQQRVA